MGEPSDVRKFKARHLKPGEEVAAHVSGYIGKLMGSGKDRQHNGALIVTDHRVVFYCKSLVGEVLQTIDLSKITSIERKSTLGHRTVRIHTSHDDLEFKNADKDGEQAACDAIEIGRAKHATAAAPPAVPDALSQLKKLAELRDAGVLTEQEFAIKKTELLARL